jgi:microcystin-dependent protein
MTLYKWSQTAALDATSDSTINWAEGQPPSSVNDAGRAMMAAIAKYRDDVAGAIVTSGTSTAYLVSSYQGFDGAVRLGGQAIAFTPHVTNGATVTLNVDGLGARPLRASPGVELLPGTIIQGTPYVAVYSSPDAAFYLRGLYGNPYNVPLGAGLDYWGTVAPNSSFAFPVGQAISRTTYSALFSLLGTTWGAGDGSATFNLPDKRGRVSIVKDDMGGAAALRLTNAVAGFAGDALGAAGGSQSHALTLAELPTGITSAGSNLITVTGGTSGNVCMDLTPSATPGGAFTFRYPTTLGAAPILATGNNNINVASNNTGGAAHAHVPPAIVCNYIIRIS